MSPSILSGVALLADVTITGFSIVWGIFVAAMLCFACEWMMRGLGLLFHVMGAMMVCIAGLIAAAIRFVIAITLNMSFSLRT